jgi:hypothetical protein
MHRKHGQTNSLSTRCFIAIGSVCVSNLGDDADSCATSLVASAAPHAPSAQSWRTVYSTRQHGTSFRTLLANCEGEQPLILVLDVAQRSSTVVIGALIPNGIRLGHQKFFGGAETFVFRFGGGHSALMPARDSHPVSRADVVAKPFDPAAKEQRTHDDSDECVVYRWTHDNEYFLNCRMDYLAIGGGAHGAAIYLDSSLSNGSTSRCTTFASPPLVAPVDGSPAECDGGVSVLLDVIAVEIYAIGAPAPTGRRK